MKKQFLNLIRPIRRYFGHEKIIYSKHMRPGKYQFTHTHKGLKLVRIAYTNHIKIAGTVPMTDVLFNDITSVKQLPSKWQKDLAWIFKYRAKSIITHFNKPTEKNAK